MKERKLLEKDQFIVILITLAQFITGIRMGFAIFRWPLIPVLLLEMIQYHTEKSKTFKPEVLLLKEFPIGSFERFILHRSEFVKGRSKAFLFLFCGGRLTHVIDLEKIPVQVMNTDKFRIPGECGRAVVRGAIATDRAKRQQLPHPEATLMQEIDKAIRVIVYDPGFIGTW